MTAIDAAIQRIKEADSKAQRSQAAFALGPAAFNAYLQAEAEAARKRFEETNGINGPTGTAPAKPPG